MATAGKLVITANGKVGVRVSSGKSTVFNASAECPECCGGCGCCLTLGNTSFWDGASEDVGVNAGSVEDDVGNDNPFNPEVVCDGDNLFFHFAVENTDDGTTWTGTAAGNTDFEITWDENEFTYVDSDSEGPQQPGDSGPATSTTSSSANWDFNLDEPLIYYFVIELTPVCTIGDGPYRVTAKVNGGAVEAYIELDTGACS